MPIERCTFVTRSQIRSERDTLFVFGDNMIRAGFGGQAREFRGEPNAVGIPTKWGPSMASSAFFSNADFGKVKPRLDEALAILAAHLSGGGRVVMPAAGIGTGLADLERRAPEIFLYIADQIAALEAMAVKS